SGAPVRGPGREETSFLFLAEGQGREALGLHHDGEVDAFWLQLEGRRLVTIGPPVPPGTPEDLPARALPARVGAHPSAHGWWTGPLEPGTLFHLPPRTPHRVIYRGRSLALSLTWKRRARGAPPRGPAARAPARARRRAAPGVDANLARCDGRAARGRLRTADRARAARPARFAPPHPARGPARAGRLALLLNRATPRRPAARAASAQGGLPGSGACTRRETPAPRADR